MNEVTIGIIGLAMVLALFLTGIELGFGMAVIGFLGLTYLQSLEAAANYLATDVFEVFSSYGLTVIPLFILMGQIAFNSGIAEKLFALAHRLFGRVPGGLALATVAGATAFKAICGSAPATTATFASVAVPEMDKYNYNRKLSTGVTTVVGTLGNLIPPSVLLIILGLMTEQSIGRLFLAGLIPGLMIAMFFGIVIIGWCLINPTLGPAGRRFSWREKTQFLPEVIWPVLVFLVIMGGMLKGWFSPTEAGSIGTFAVILLVVLKRNLNFRQYVKSVKEALSTACMVFILVAGSTVMGHFLAATKIPLLAGDWISGLPLPRWLIMVCIIMVFELGGSFIDDFAFMILAMPIFSPVAEKLGYDPIWFCIVISVSVMIGVIIPPIATNVFIVRNITGSPVGVIYMGAMPFLISLVAAMVLLFVFPEICLFLPKFLMG
jgi:C4-dicarboxylate transporter, DctM subunit